MNSILAAVERESSFSDLLTVVSHRESSLQPTGGFLIGVVGRKMEGKDNRAVDILFLVVCDFT